MHRPIFGHSFAVLVAPVLLSVLAFNFLNKKRITARRNAEDVTGASSSMATPTEANSDGSSPSPTKANNDASSSMAAPTETNSDGSSLSPTKANNGASSSLTGNCYEVFLTFRGLDTRHGFTDHLYKGLVDAGIDAFRDDDELCYGEDIRPVLMEAITSSKILIPIFSENYGTSSWCLDELVQMMELKKKNGQIVLPIFYKVKPDEVRHQIGSFGEASHERERCLRKRHFDPTILKKWKQALLEVSTLRGYEADGYEAKLVKLIVQKVLNEPKKKFELIISENLVGIDIHVNKIMEFVDNKYDATLFLGIHGMGGIGKTTLAKIIYNKLSNQFEHRSFIANVRESWKHNGVHYLQNQLIYGILKQGNEVRNEDERTEFISSKLKVKKVFVLLHDMDNVIQLKLLAGNHSWFSSGSRIVITTKNGRVLEEARVDYIYEDKEMDDNQSLILFSKHAFRRDSPQREFEDLTHEVVSNVRGLPLSLEVVGSLLCRKEPAQWRDTIEKLKKVPHMTVQERLRISYEALGYRQKQILLDIACFFVGVDKKFASYMWDDCDFFQMEGIEALIFMGLVKVGNDHKLIMHDQLRDLCREIVREENQWEPLDRIRLWDYKEVQKVLKDNKKMDKIKAIDMSEGGSEGSSKVVMRDGNIYTSNQFKELESLKFLHLEGAHLIGDFKDSMKELRLLRWKKCPINFEAKNFHLKKLVALELTKSKINEKWEGWSSFVMAKKLEFLDLSYCDSLEDMDFLSAFKKLKVLILNGCGRLKRIDTSIGDMKALLRLELCGCGNLMKLPVKVGNLENLEILNISSSGIEELPNGIGSLRKLRELRASNCRNLKGEVVESMCNLSSLQRLDFLHCHNLQSPPNLPSSLTHLGVTCQSHKLPLLSQLAHLKELQVFHCRFLKCIQVLPSMLLKNSECSQPMDIEESKSPQFLNTPFMLEFLDVQWCQSLETLDVSQFIHLRTLSAKYCENLLQVRGLDESKDLESLVILRCNSIERLDPPKFESLKTLNVRLCEKLVEIQGLNRSKYLESINIQGCASIKRLDLPKSRSLKELYVQSCENLAEVQGLDRLEFLVSVNISSCIAIGRLLLPKYGSLKKLCAQWCKKLAEIQGLDRSEYLERLDIKECTSIRRLLLPKFGRLKELEAGGCKNLVDIQDLDKLEYLERLDISKCTSIERLDLQKSGRLKELKAEGCRNLAKIQGLDKSEYLERLDIKGCTSIQMLLLPNFGRLTELEARGCKNLVEIQDLDTSEFLERLDISKCSSIGRLDLPKSGSLKILYTKSCKDLTEIRGLERLEFLERLDISRCNSIERLLLPKSESLTLLNTKDCENLVEIQGLDRLQFLEELIIIGCKSLKTIPELSETQIFQHYEIANGKTIEFGLEYMDDSNEST